MGEPPRKVGMLIVFEKSNELDTSCQLTDLMPDFDYIERALLTFQSTPYHPICCCNGMSNEKCSKTEVIIKRI
jgi:hypothetical protein